MSTERPVYRRDAQPLSRNRTRQCLRRLRTLVRSPLGAEAIAELLAALIGSL
ncbi:hypothetical protein [Nocardia sp. NPDC057030]|uniref:hypothetical protein n=1 Tax=unclassified Nocardia TaxID=2637762 RepID=UPI0036442271